MNLKDVIQKSKDLYQIGGIRFLIYFVLNSPLRMLNNRIAIKREKKLLKEVEMQEIPYGLRLPESKSQRIIVSLTTYPPRINGLYLCLKSLLLQSILPNKIIVYLGSDTKNQDISPEIEFFSQFGIEFRFDNKKNLRGHKKYFYAIQEYPDDIIITVDDDMVYPNDMIENLIDMHVRYEGAICARRVHLIGFDHNGKIKPYETWKKNVQYIRYPSYCLLATGMAGILYPPSSLSKEAFDEKNIMELCSGADDIWLKCMEIINGTKVVFVPSIVACAEVPESQYITLRMENTGMVRGNDGYLRKVMAHYGISENRFQD